MASIRARRHNLGTTWQVIFARVGLPTFRKSFISRGHAEEFASREVEFIEDPEKFFDELDPRGDARKRAIERKHGGPSDAKQIFTGKELVVWAVDPETLELIGKKIVKVTAVDDDIIYLYTKAAMDHIAPTEE